MGMYIVKTYDSQGGEYPTVGIVADTVMDALKIYEDRWFPGVFTDPSFGIGEVIIEYVGSIDNGK